MAHMLASRVHSSKQLKAVQRRKQSNPRDQTHTTIFFCMCNVLSKKMLHLISIIQINNHKEVLKIIGFPPTLKTALALFAVFLIISCMKSKTHDLLNDL